MRAFGPPILVLTHPGCMAIIKIPVSFKSTERLFMAIFKAVLEQR